jgi:hypothetical protein
MAAARPAPPVPVEPEARKAVAVKAENQEKVRTARDFMAKMESLAEAAREGLAHHLTRLANTVALAVAVAVATSAAAAAVAAV